MATSTYTKAGVKATKAATLDETIFELTPKSHELVKQAYVAYQANGRENLAKTLTRGNVRGGGKKPWKQKGTGRARFGSIRVPIWRGGGITFGPLGVENYSKALPTQSKRTALKYALSMKNSAAAIIVIEDLAVASGKTQDAQKLLNKLGATGSVLIAVENKTPELERVFRNLKNVTVVQATYLNVYNVVNADKIIISENALVLIHAWLSKNPKETK